MRIIEKNTKDLIPYENNPRFNDNAVDGVASSIKEFGFKVPIIIDRNNVIIAGHTRWKASKKLGLKSVPCIIADDLNEEQIKAFRLADNKVGELAEWDFTKLEKELSSLTMDMETFGFDFKEVEEEMTKQMDANRKVVEDDAPEVDEESEPISKFGDVWQLGRHRLMCGDSTDRSYVDMLMNGNKADMVLTDPPYGVNIVSQNKVGGDKPFGKVGGDNIIKCNSYMQIKGDETTDTARLNYEIIKECSEHQIIFGGNYFTDFLPPRACWCIWDKENTGNFADVEMAWTSFDKGAKLYRWLWNGLCRKGERSVEGKSRVHPTQKPVGLIAEILKDFTDENDIILDCFGGSGSTLIACEQIDRVCYMMEYEPHYCDVIINRWENLTGKKAVKL